MLPTQARPAERTRRPPPLWFVTNGDVTVGPVRTDLLQRGVVHGRIPEDCLVRELTWRRWRRLDQIREVRAVTRQHGAGALAVPAGTSHAELVARFCEAQDAAEVLTLALHECFDATAASFGMVQRMRGADRRAVTTCVRGVGMTGRLGVAVPEDRALALARVGGLIVGPPGAGDAERCIAERLGAPPDLSGVALVPVGVRGHLVAVLELGRVGHPFRASDVQILERVAAAAALALHGF